MMHKQEVKPVIENSWHEALKEEFHAHLILLI